MEKSRKILIVDDDDLMCASLKEMLEECGYHVYVARHGDDAVILLNKYKIDLVLFDFSLYDEHEFSSVERMKDALSNTIVIVMVDRSRVSKVINKLCLDTVDYILKPFDTDYLKKTVEKALYKQQLELNLKKALFDKEIINNINKSIATSIDIRESFSVVCGELKKIIPFARACLIISNEQGEWFQVFALAKKYNFSEINAGESFPMEGSLLERIIQTGEPIIVNDTKAGSFWTDRVLFNEGILSRMGFPLIHKGKVLGAITFGAEKINSFDEQSYFYLWQIAPQLAIVLENSILFNRIKTSEERYKMLFNYAADSMMMIDLNGKILTVNRREEEIIGYQMEELIGKYVFDFLTSSSKKTVISLLSRAINKKVPTTEIEVINRNKQILVMELDIIVVRERNDIIYILAHFRDITERKNLELELKREKEKLDNIVSEIGADLLIIGRDKTIHWANKRLINNHPLGKNIVNHTCYDTFCNLQEDPVDCPSFKVFKTAKINQTERVLYNHNKKKFCNVITSPIFDKDGKVIQVLELIQDITEKKREEERQKKLQQQLIHSDRLISIGRLAAGVAHEINTPLAIISGMTQGFLERKKLFNNETIKEFKTIQKVTKRIEKIVNSLLELSHFEGNEQPRLVNINKIIKETVTLIIEPFAKKDKKVILKLSSGLPKIKGFADQLQQVIMNLLINADDATKPGDTVSITTNMKNKNTININFEDTGTGIPENQLSRIFDPFFTNKEVGKGTGLGLSITYGIIKRHNGAIYVKSAVGKGTKFEINLPVNFDKAVFYG
ncbi:MAG: PAS domain S-box protein [Candidatus Kuenenia sp.]|nr:PAS domain S-box protein [Candidatus Kuenenia hertensis]